MAKAKYFTQNNEKVYPISHTKAVYDGNGKVLEDRLTEDETAISSLQTDVKGKADKTDVDNKLSSNGAISDTTVAFTEASARENIVSNEKSSTLFGKVQKWFSDLKKVAFTGSYNDLIDTPSNATSDTDGFMSKEDKSTVDSLNSTFLDKSSARYSFFNLLKWNSSNNKIVEIDNRSTPVYYGGNEIATKSDIPSTSDFLKTSGGTLSGNITLTSGYCFLSSYSNNLKLLRVGSNSNYFGEQAGNTAMYNYFGYRNSANTTIITNHFGSSYNSSYKTNLSNYYGKYAATNYFGSSATMNYFGDGANTSHYRGSTMYLGGTTSTVYLGNSTSYPVYMQGSTSYKVVGTTTGYNTKIHVASSQPSNMSVGDIWFKIPS